MAEEPPNSLEEVRIHGEIGDDPAELDALADAVVRGCSICYARIKSLRALIEAVQRHPHAVLAPAREERSEDWRPPARRGHKALTELRVFAGEVEDADCRSLDIRVRLTVTSRFAGAASFGEASFGGDAWFGEASFAGDASFGNASFAGDAKFVGASFGEGAWFEEASFGGAASFREASFEGDVWFGETSFGRDASFGETSFGEAASFREARFGADAWFQEARFRGATFFMRASYGGVARFDKATFASSASFDGASFAGGARFSRACFARDASFLDAMFTGVAVFAEASFAGKAGFRTARFARKASFSVASFEGETDFTDASFGGEAGFWQANFARQASFLHATFAGVAAFMEADFAREASFRRARFARDAWFTDTTFAGDARFIEAGFGGVARFWHAGFAGHARFEETSLAEGARFERARFARDTRFDRATVYGRLALDSLDRSPNRLSLSHADIRPGTVVELDVAHLRREDHSDREPADEPWMVERDALSAWIASLPPQSVWRRTLKQLDLAFWWRHPIRHYLGLGKRGAVIRGETSESPEHLRDAAAQYNILRNNFRTQPSTEVHEDLCHFRHMELMRRAAWRNRPSFGRRILLGLEWLIMRNMLGYMIYPSRIATTAGFFLLLFTLIFACFASPGTITHNVRPDEAMQIWGSDLLNPLYFSLMTFVTLGYGDFAPLGAFKLLCGLEGLLGVTLLALFTVAWARKMIR